MTKTEKLLRESRQPALPSNFAFLAMVQYRLGKKAEARATLEKVRKAIKDPDWANSEENRGFLAEAEALIEGKTVQPRTAASTSSTMTATGIRHTAATELRARHGVEAARTILGHSKVETTQIYAERDLSQAALLTSYESLSPPTPTRDLFGAISVRRQPLWTATAQKFLDKSTLYPAAVIEPFGPNLLPDGRTWRHASVCYVLRCVRRLVHFIRELSGSNSCWHILCRWWL